MREVLDTRFLLEHFFSDDPQVLEFTRDKLRVLRRGGTGLLSALALAEFYDQVCRRAGRTEADEKCRAIVASGLSVHPVTSDVALSAGALRCQHRDVPMADCIIAATANEVDGRVISDDPHFRQLRGVRVTWR